MVSNGWGPIKHARFDGRCDLRLVAHESDGEAGEASTGHDLTWALRASMQQSLCNHAAHT